MSVEEKLLAIARYSRSNGPPVQATTGPRITHASVAQIGTWRSPLTVIVRPACSRRGRLISRPIRKRSRMRPISAISSIASSSATTWKPTCGPSTAPARM